jgi:hypothetical protein
MADEFTVDHASTPEHFLHVLSLGEGIDLAHFDQASVKPLRLLYQETQRRDVVLMFNPRTGRVERHAQSVRTRIYELQAQRVWYEVARTYPSGRVIKKKKDFSTSETRKRGESSIDCAVRCNLEEMKPIWENIGFMPSASELTPKFEPDQVDAHESSVYSGIRSIVTIQWFDLYLDFHNPAVSLGEEILILKDVSGDGLDSEDWVKTYLQPEDCMNLKQAPR